MHSKLYVNLCILDFFITIFILIALSWTSQEQHLHLEVVTMLICNNNRKRLPSNSMKGVGWHMMNNERLRHQNQQPTYSSLPSIGRNVVTKTTVKLCFQKSIIKILDSTILTLRQK